MIEFAQNLKRGISDSFRRTGMKIGGGIVAAIAFGFLTAALWSFLAVELDWGSTLASLAVGGGFLVIALALFIAARKPRHRMPTGDDLKREVQARVSLAKDAAVGQVRSKFDEAVQPLKEKAERAGATPERAAAVRDGAIHGASQVDQAASTNLGSMGKLIGAFAVGLTIASAIRGRNDDDDDFDDII
ncbi:phage holin family protein [Paracoccus sp. PARArs4]|uniref:phage holin family protein n=1 Tax=Paracoccus sp. PARArs4 TaxID=2853442 RepID=UPI0024A6E2CC|nr:phage holin family protein [Paracoccus sp. PARArs4]